MTEENSEMTEENSEMTEENSEMTEENSEMTEERGNDGKRAGITERKDRNSAKGRYLFSNRLLLIEFYGVNSEKDLVILGKFIVSLVGFYFLN